MHDLLVEDLPGELLRLVEDHSAVFGIGVVAEVGALVDETLAVGIDHDAERIAVLLETVAHREVAEGRRVAVPADGMAAGPVAVRHGADLERHADAVAGVEARTAHLGELPVRAEIAAAPLRIRLEPATGKHHRAARQFRRAPVDAGDHAMHAVVVWISDSARALCLISMLS